MAVKPELVVTPGEGGLQIRSLRKSYKKRPVIRDVSMTCGAVSWWPCWGDGSGKTTCFYSIAGGYARS